MADVALEIWNDAVPDGYPSTAEGRAKVDLTLKAGLFQIEDESVRHHAANLIRIRRADAMRAGIE